MQPASEETLLDNLLQWAGKKLIMMSYDISAYTYLCCVLCHIPHDDNDLPFEALEHGSVRSLGKLPFRSKRGAEWNVDAAWNVTPNKTEKKS